MVSRAQPRFYSDVRSSKHTHTHRVYLSLSSQPFVTTVINKQSILMRTYQSRLIGFVKCDSYKTEQSMNKHFNTLIEIIFINLT